MNELCSELIKYINERIAACNDCIVENDTTRCMTVSEHEQIIIDVLEEIKTLSIED